MYLDIPSKVKISEVFPLLYASFVSRLSQHSPVAAILFPTKVFLIQIDALFNLVWFRHDIGRDIDSISFKRRIDMTVGNRHLNPVFVLFIYQN